MNKFWKFSGVFAVLVAVVAFVGVTSAFAQGPNQPDGMTPLGMNQAQNGAGVGMGLMAVDEDAMHEAVAAALGLTLDEFEARVADGENAYTVALELGIDFAVVQAAMDAVHEAAFQQAVDDGLVSQEQAGLMLSHRGGQSGQGGQSDGMNHGQSNGSTDMMARGAGSNGAQTGECQYPAP